MSSGSSSGSAAVGHATWGGMKNNATAEVPTRPPGVLNVPYQATVVPAGIPQVPHPVGAVQSPLPPGMVKSYPPGTLHAQHHTAMALMMQQMQMDMQKMQLNSNSLPQPQAKPQQQPQPQHPQQHLQSANNQSSREYQKEIARRILATLDDESVWRLAFELHQRGLIRPKMMSIMGAMNAGIPSSMTKDAATHRPPGCFTPKSEAIEISLAESTAPSSSAAASCVTRASESTEPAQPQQFQNKQSPSASSSNSSTGEASVSGSTAPSSSASVSSVAKAFESTEPAQLQQSAASERRSDMQNKQSPSASPGNRSTVGANNSGSEESAATRGVAISERRISVAQMSTSKSKLRDGPSDADKVSSSEENSTSLILRNLPCDFDQQKCQDWVDKHYKGLYDFLLWFPAKKTSRLNNCSYAFVNFITAHHAKRFRGDFHLMRFYQSDVDADGKNQWPLSIAVAKVQGFSQNYVRFHHLLEDTSYTLCKPYFDPRAVAALSSESLAAAKQTGSNMVREGVLGDSSPTTLIIRNLPSALDSQDVARGWLDGAGFGSQYNFFLYLPAKRRRLESGTSTGGAGQGLAYAFVNFYYAETAKACVDKLNGQTLSEGDPTLSVVAARVQGLRDCRSHFSSLCEGGRVEPWLAPDAQKAHTSVPTAAVSGQLVRFQ